MMTTDEKIKAITLIVGVILEQNKDQLSVSLSKKLRSLRDSPSAGNLVPLVVEFVSEHGGFDINLDH